MGTNKSSDTKSNHSNITTKERGKGSKESFRSEEDDDIEKLKIQEKNMKIALVSTRDKIKKIKNNKGVLD